MSFEWMKSLSNRKGYSSQENTPLIPATSLRALKSAEARSANVESGNPGLHAMALLLWVPAYAGTSGRSLPSWPDIAVRRTASLRSPMFRPSTSCLLRRCEVVDARHKAGHDDGRVAFQKSHVKAPLKAWLSAWAAISPW
jgi:hypothetical protein